MPATQNELDAFLGLHTDAFVNWLEDAVFEIKGPLAVAAETAEFDDNNDDDNDNDAGNEEEEYDDDNNDDEHVELAEQTPSVRSSVVVDQRMHPSRVASAVVCRFPCVMCLRGFAYLQTFVILCDVQVVPERTSRLRLQDRPSARGLNAALSAAVGDRLPRYW